MTDGYNGTGSHVWHQEQRCSGAFFPAALAMTEQVAKNRGYKPCANCCDGEWPSGGD